MRLTFIQPREEVRVEDVGSQGRRLEREDGEGDDVCAEGK